MSTKMVATLAGLSLDAGVGGDEQKGDAASGEQNNNDPTEEELRALLARYSSLILSLGEQLLDPAVLQKEELETSIQELNVDIGKEKDETEKAKLQKELRQTRRDLRSLRSNQPKLTKVQEDKINAQITDHKKQQAEIGVLLAALQQQRQQSLPDTHQSIESELSLQCVFVPLRRCYDAC